MKNENAYNKVSIKTLFGFLKIIRKFSVWHNRAEKSLRICQYTRGMFSGKINISAELQNSMEH